MNNRSFVYSDYPLQEAIRAGYFEPVELNVKLDDKFNSVYIPGGHKINSETTILYFPGAFGSFHPGHVGCIESSYQLLLNNGADPDNTIVIISPAHSDYTAYKYGEASGNASNATRYNAIKQAMAGSKVKWGIDLAPMLNYRCDNNITDLVNNFVQSQGLVLDQMVNPVYLICGKDRGDFIHLAKLCPKIEVVYIPDSSGHSTSAQYKLPNRTKKKLLLRVHNQQQVEVFAKYFGNQYTSVEPIYIDDEINKAKSIARAIYYLSGKVATICKDYKAFAAYIPVSREWLNPLEQSGQFRFDPRIEQFRDMTVIDSDIFSGSTAKYLKQHYNINVAAVHNLSKQLDDVELLDIDDFVNNSWCYPYVDISSRASIDAFTAATYAKFDQMVAELKSIGTDNA